MEEAPVVTAKGQLDGCPALGPIGNRIGDKVKSGGEGDPLCLHHKGVKVSLLGSRVTDVGKCVDPELNSGGVVPLQTAELVIPFGMVTQLFRAVTNGGQNVLNITAISGYLLGKGSHIEHMGHLLGW